MQRRGAQIAVRRAAEIGLQLRCGTCDDDEDTLKLHPDAEEPLTLHDFEYDDDDDASGGGCVTS